MKTVERREQGTFRGKNTPSHHHLPPKRALGSVEEGRDRGVVSQNTMVWSEFGTILPFPLMTRVSSEKLLNLSVLCLHLQNGNDNPSCQRVSVIIVREGVKPVTQGLTQSFVKR